MDYRATYMDIRSVISCVAPGKHLVKRCTRAVDSGSLLFSIIASSGFTITILLAGVFVEEAGVFGLNNNIMRTSR